MFLKMLDLLFLFGKVINNSQEKLLLTNNKQTLRRQTNVRTYKLET
jgi:hypothetical protein